MVINAHQSRPSFTKAVEAVGVPLDPQKQLVVPWCSKASVIWFQDWENVNVSCQTQDGCGIYPGYGTVVVSVMESRTWQTTNSCIDGAKVGQNFFLPVRTSDPSIGPPTRGKVHLSRSVLHLVNAVPLLFGLWRKLPLIKSLDRLALLHCNV